MRTSIVLAALAASFLTGCGACAELATEQAMKAAGVDADIDEKGGKITFRGENGETVEVNAEGDEGTVTIKGKDGELRFDGGGEGKLPDGFPFALAAGSKIQGSASMKNATERTFMASLQNDGDIEALAAHYKRELESKGLAVERTDMDMNGQKFVTLAGRAEGREASVAISSTEEDGLATQISVREGK
ncbi:hypothetical protein [Vulgatibacter sp.]|uniref:hypothetical protein n=1 Tax=Vulgatibacter sp. TaxID=1971226 RepID=UPI0035687D04